MTCLAHQIDLSEELIDFPQLYKRRLAACADSIALQCEDELITYAQLDARANRLANYLLTSGMAPHQQIGLCLNRSVDAIVAMLGVLKAGSVFVPLDPAFPIDRLNFMVTDAEIGVILCHAEYRPIFSSGTGVASVLLVDPRDQRIEQATDEDPLMSIAPNDLAYIMYTSGSTGMPKGVQIEHRSLATYCFADIEVYQLRPEDRTLQFSTMNFDIAIEEIFPPLLTGGTVVIRPYQRLDDEVELSAIIDRYRITAIHVAAAYWHEWVDVMLATNRRVPRSLRLAIVTGEKVSPVHYRRWVSECDHAVLWCNAYGPTEVTVTSTVFIPDRDWSGESMPIGKPLKGYEAWILDDRDQPLGVGETGELYLGGTAVARGYLNRPERNAIAFRQIELPGVGLRRLYKSGDLARWLPTGDIEFAGRIDHQIKLGSYRIEPGEIEHQAAQHPRVLDALVTVEQFHGQKALIAYIARGSNRLTAQEMTLFLRSKLPAYMVPNRFVFLEAFPKTINGKIDRSALPDPSTCEIARTAPVDAPRDELERELATIMADILQVAELGIHDDFFAFGLSSILVTRAIVRVRSKLDLQIPVRDFFANPTVASIALLLNERSGKATSRGARTLLSKSLRSRLPTPEPCFIPCGDERLFAVYYPPVTAARQQGILICPPLGHEYARAHRNLQQLAVQLSRAGFSVLRFDYSGIGNSTGNPAAGTPHTLSKEIQVAADSLRQRSCAKTTSIIGVRLGATLASTIELSQFDRQVLIDPVFSGADYLTLLDRFHRQALTGRTRYQRIRTSQRDQLYGEDYSAAKRDALANLQFVSSESSRRLVVTSRDYLSDQINVVQDCCPKIVETQDEIYWNNAEFTESAFACPEIFEATINFLSR